MPLPPSIPQHLLEPGLDGYRTPTIEDPEHHAHPWNSKRRYVTDQSTFHSFRGLQNDRFTSSPNAVDHKTSADETDDERPKYLTWKQRMKHVTWAYFTLTMATGGIANVISAGRLPAPVRWTNVAEPNSLT
jgi:hypothetical protein